MKMATWDESVQFMNALGISKSHLAPALKALLPAIVRTAGTRGKAEPSSLKNKLSTLDQ
jgi:Mg-chelatase subunit ChlI